jgi:predicted DNA-binding transcriptional regulator AlpA
LVNEIHFRTATNEGDSNMAMLPETGFLRLPQIIGNPNVDPPIAAPIPVSKSTWWAGVKSGRFPKPVKLGPRITAWRVEDIRELIRRWGEHQ